MKRYLAMLMLAAPLAACGDTINDITMPTQVDTVVVTTPPPPPDTVVVTDTVRPQIYPNTLSATSGGSGDLLPVICSLPDKAPDFDDCFVTPQYPGQTGVPSNINTPVVGYYFGLGVEDEMVLDFNANITARSDTAFSFNNFRVDGMIVLINETYDPETGEYDIQISEVPINRSLPWSGDDAHVELGKFQADYILADLVVSRETSCWLLGGTSLYTRGFTNPLGGPSFNGPMMGLSCGYNPGLGGPSFNTSASESGAQKLDAVVNTRVQQAISDYRTNRLGR